MRVTTAFNRVVSLAGANVVSVSFTDAGIVRRNPVAARLCVQDAVASAGRRIKAVAVPKLHIRQISNGL